MTKQQILDEFYKSEYKLFPSFIKNFRENNSEFLYLPTKAQNLKNIFGDLYPTKKVAKEIKKETTTKKNGKVNTSLDFPETFESGLADFLDRQKKEVNTLTQKNVEQRQSCSFIFLGVLITVLTLYFLFSR